MGAKRGTGRGSFIDTVTQAIDSFYGDVVQQLKTWRPAAPRLREQLDAPDEPVSLTSTAQSSQDGSEPSADPHTATAGGH